jgi:adenine-specific DNA-methyltransferase
MKLFHERILPTLDGNIKDGNSLVDIDFYSGELDFGFEKKIKPFSWQNAFPEIFKIKQLTPNQDFKKQFEKVKKLHQDTDDLLNKYVVKELSWQYGKINGFDVVISNPPYGALFSNDELNYFKNRYNTAVWRSESYVMFIEQGLKLLKSDGLLGFIIPDTLLNLGFTQPARELLLRYSKIQEIIGLPSRIFSGATVDTIIILTEKADYINKFHPSNVWVKTYGKKQTISSVENPNKEFFIKTKDWFEQNTFNLQTDNTEKKLLTKIESEKKTVNDIAEMFYGIKAYQVGKGKPPQTEKNRDEKPFTSEKKLAKKWLPFYDGKHIGRYQLLWKENNWLNYGEWLAEPRKPSVFEGEKILIRKIAGKTLIATYIPETSYCNTLLFILKLGYKDYSYKSILAILNSNLIGWYFQKKFQISDADIFPQIMIRDILQFPIPKIDEKNDAELNKLVDQLLQLNEEKAKVKLQTKITQLQAKIDYCEGRINEIVYLLYLLTEEEIKIVEKNV